MWILLDPKLDARKIAFKRPLTVPFSSSFVVDVSKLAHPDDIKKDMYGKWLHSGSHTDVFRCTYSEDKDSVRYRSKVMSDSLATLCSRLENSILYTLVKLYTMRVRVE